MNLSKAVKVSSAITPTAGAAASTDLEGSVADMAGFESIAIRTYSPYQKQLLTLLSLRTILIDCY